MFLRVATQSLKPVKLFSQQLPTFLLFCDRWSVAQQCWIRLHSSSNIVGATHAHYAWFTKTYGLYPSHDALQVGTLWERRVAQWWEHSPPTNVARVWILASMPYVGWVCCWFCPLIREVFLRVLWFSPLLKNLHFQIPIRSGTHGHVSTSSYELLSSPWVIIVASVCTPLPTHMQHLPTWWCNNDGGCCFRLHAAVGVKIDSSDINFLKAQLSLDRPF